MYMLSLCQVVVRTKARSASHQQVSLEHMLSICRANAAQRQRILVPSVPLLVSKMLLRNRLSLYSAYASSGVFRGIFWSLDRMIGHMFRRCWTYAWHMLFFM